MGDPASIGPEIALKAVSDDGINRICTPLIIGDAAWLQETAENLGIRGVQVQAINSAGEAAGSPGAVNVVDLANVSYAEVRVGEIGAAQGRASVEYIERAVELAMAGDLDAISTGPINKESLKAAGVKFPGHTEMLGALTGSSTYETMFVVDNLRIFFATRHLSLRDAVDAVTSERILEVLDHARNALAMLGFDEPKIAVAALNPHGGERGLFGTEEMDEIAPAVQKARQQGWDVVGPVPADSVFPQAIQGRYTAVIALYHDQGHIAAKSYSYDRTVSVTTGLPILRTTVDHGTALDIAGKGIADATNLSEAIKTAVEYAPRWRSAASGRNAN